MSFISGFKDVLNRFKKRNTDSVRPLSDSQKRVSGEIIPPKQMPQTINSQVTSSQRPSEKKEKIVSPQKVKVHWYNWGLLVIALVLAVVALLFYSGQKKEETSTNKVSSVIEKVIPQGDGGEVSLEKDETADLFEGKSNNQVPAEIMLSEEEISVLGHPLKKTYERTIFVNCVKGELKILSVSLSRDIPDLILDASDCEEKESLVEKIGKCEIKLTWTPQQDAQHNVDIKIKWQDLSSLENKEKIKSLPIFIETKKEEIKTDLFEDKIEEKPVEKKEDESFFDSLFSSSEDKQEDEVLPIVKEKPKREKLEDCRKYAVRAYTLKGDFLGWIQPSSKVYSPRCGNIIGTRKVNGQVVDNSGNLLGYDVDAFAEKKSQQKKKVDMPLDLVDFEGEKQKNNVDWNIVAEDRSSARDAIIATTPKGSKDGSDKWESHQMEDHMGVIRSAKMSKVPFTIKSANQISSMPKDEEYVIRRTKPISAVLAYPLQKSEYGGVIPATAIVERNVYGGSGRTVVIPSGSLLLGHASGSWPQTYTRFARVALQWDRIVRPDGAEFIFSAHQPITGDAQGKLGVPGKGSTDYLEQFVKPMITSLVPAAINLISPTAELYTRQVLSDKAGDLSILETGQETSKEKAKQAMIATWNKIANKFVEDTLDNTTPPFTVPAGTRLTIYPQEDIMLRFVDDDSIFGEKNSYANLVDTATMDSSKGITGMAESKKGSESGPNSMNIDISKEMGQMDQAFQVRKEEEARKAEKMALPKEDFTSDNFDPLEAFGGGGGGEVAIGRDEFGDVYQDADGYYGYDGDTVVPVEESAIIERY
ncbi:MAG: hypothetical protein JXR30_00480 [Alphaproteobacteria bacterium]|nr:hypothetical protein [Alphaproteobacteria bacterium]